MLSRLFCNAASNPCSERSCLMFHFMWMKDIRCTLKANKWNRAFANFSSPSVLKTCTPSNSCFRGQPDWMRKIVGWKFSALMNQEWTSKDRWACMTSEASDGMLWGLHQSHLSRTWGWQSRQRNCAHVYRTSLGLVVGNHVLQSHQVQELLSIHQQINPDYPLTYTSQWHCNLWLLNSLVAQGPWFIYRGDVPVPKNLVAMRRDISFGMILTDSEIG